MLLKFEKKLKPALARIIIIYVTVWPSVYKI